MNPNNAVALAALCALLAAGGAIVHDYSETRVAAASRVRPSSPSSLPCVAEMKRRFMSANCPPLSEELTEYRSLSDCATMEHDLHELHAVQATHRRHVAILIERYVAAQNYPHLARHSACAAQKGGHISVNKNQISSY
ncbi:hypothetical protein CCAX7_40530 [Capsulimonas corticalis]|uniref:Uncharacterized protein n=1 Tax=Capsulimonas corticalis TaxID=2219043 RepID=A0A402D7B3_9BACT|nr:hypothetical protein [Capsulimonas corticalis]BDI32002.1 hypothetical protein CCAX7_40530 [Capsulimonas corticalis]